MWTGQSIYSCLCTSLWLLQLFSPEQDQVTAQTGCCKVRYLQGPMCNAGLCPIETHQCSSSCKLCTFPDCPNKRILKKSIMLLHPPASNTQRTGRPTINIKLCKSGNTTYLHNGLWSESISSLSNGLRIFLFEGGGVVLLINLEQSFLSHII